MKLCIVVPMYNEAAIARQSLATILEHTRRLPPPVTVLVVDDCSRDETQDIVAGMIRERPDGHLRLIAHAENQGYGGANRTGANWAVEQGYDYVLFMDSDLTNHPRYLQDFHHQMLAGCDYIKATRFSGGGGYVGVPWRRRAVSRAGNFLGRLITGLPLHDLTNGFRAVRTDVLKNLHLTENHFSLIVEELIKSRPYVRRWCEIPVILGNRPQDARHTAFRYDLGTYWKYFKYFFTR